MTRLLHYLLPLACFVAAGAAVSILSPRRVEGQYSSPVRVMNTNSQPIPSRDRDNPAQQPYIADGFCSVVDGVQNSCDFTLPPPAPGQRLVIDYVSATSTQVSTASAPWEIVIVVHRNADYAGYGGTHQYYFPINRIASDSGLSTFIGSHSTMLFSDDGGSPHAIIERMGITGNASMAISVSGHLVDIP
jgi:hypothetical protein